MRPTVSHGIAAAKDGGATARGVALVAAALGLTTGGCTAPLPDLEARDASIEAPCTPFADLMIEYKPAGGDNDPAAGTPALGAPDGSAVSVAVDTVLTVAFTGLGAIVDADGADIGVDVVGTPDAATQVSGYASVDGLTFVYVGDLTAESTTLDLETGGASAAGYVRLIGIAGELAVDSIEAAQTACPAAAAPGSARPLAGAHERPAP